mmetsp:Transcript_30871/g.88785  ORF Transcript_30871/g.88785 Transcript_30871/m.88785 type:complete len:209 (+) Transcript_30871:990-1616(+)
MQCLLVSAKIIQDQTTAAPIAALLLARRRAIRCHPVACDGFFRATHVFKEQPFVVVCIAPILVSIKGSVVCLHGCIAIALLRMAQAQVEPSLLARWLQHGQLLVGGNGALDVPLLAQPPRLREEPLCLRLAWPRALLNSTLSSKSSTTTGLARFKAPPAKSRQKLGGRGEHHNRPLLRRLPQEPTRETEADRKHDKGMGPGGPVRQAP